MPAVFREDRSVLQIFWALGTVFEVLLAILVMPTLGWRWLLGLSTIPLFIFAILCFVSMSLQPSFSLKKKIMYKRASCDTVFWLLPVAARERSIRRADWKPGKSSGHAEAHCDRERSADAPGETDRSQTGESSFTTSYFFLCICSDFDSDIF